jgi:hypothetical protein
VGGDTGQEKRTTSTNVTSVDSTRSDISDVSRQSSTILMQSSRNRHPGCGQLGRPASDAHTRSAASCPPLIILTSITGTLSIDQWGIAKKITSQHPARGARLAFRRSSWRGGGGAVGWGKRSPVPEVTAVSDHHRFMM